MSSANGRNNGSTVVVVKKKRFDLSKFKAQKVQKEAVTVSSEDLQKTPNVDVAEVTPTGHGIKGRNKIKNLDFDSEYTKTALDTNNAKDTLDAKDDVVSIVEPEIVPEVKKPKPQKSQRFESKGRVEATSRIDHKVQIPNLDNLLSHKKVEEPVPSMAPTSAPVAAPKKKMSGIKLVDDSKNKIGKDDGKKKQSNTRSKLFEERRVNTRYIGDDEKVRSLSALKRQREKIKRAGQEAAKPIEQKIKEVVIPETITVQELANRMAVRSTDLVKELMKMGMMITATKPIDADTAELLASELGYVVKRVSESDVENILDRPEYSDVSKMKSRAPVISVMGHVDHGKTSLLDAMRSSNIVDGESGGITQHIGASRIKVADGKYITFLDTPGHEAFTAMRMRGAMATDMVILVVAADDGVKEQTIEAINHAKAASIPIIVAVNKMDKEGANPELVINGLLAHDVLVESLGGDVLHVDVSAKTKKNLDKLLDGIMLQSELLELKANYDCPAKGVVIETKIDKSRGVVATMLVQHGKLRVGDIVLAGMSYGRVRAIIDENDRKLDVADPSVPVEILGLDEVPDSGDLFYVMQSDKEAREIVEYRIQKQKDLDAAQKSKRTLEDIFADLGDGKKKQVSLIVKGDVRGSVEAIKTSIEKLATDEVGVKVIHGGVGAISDSDLTLAKASDATIVAFNVRAGGNIKSAALDEANVRYYSIIYDVVDDVKAAMKGLLDPKKREVFLGKGEVRKVFDLSKYGKIAGSYVLEGVIKRNSQARLIRDSIVIYEGKIKALKRYKDDAKDVITGMEFGVSFEGFTDFRSGDVIESFDIVIEDH